MLICTHRGFVEQGEYRNEKYLKIRAKMDPLLKLFTLTWSCCSWTPDQEIPHEWGIENMGYWHCRGFPGSKAGPQRRAWPCWGSGLRVERGCEHGSRRRHRWRLLTFVLAVQGVHPPQPHQPHEQQHRPQDLQEETSLERRHSRSVHVLSVSELTGNCVVVCGSAPSASCGWSSSSTAGA